MPFKILLVIKRAFQQQNAYSELSKNNSNDQEYFINSVFSFPDPAAADPEFQFKKLSSVLHCTICLHQYLMEKYTVLWSLLILHPAGRPLNFDWFINSFIMAVYGKKFQVRSEFSVQSMTVKCSYGHPLFTDQSEVSALPAGCHVDFFIHFDTLTIQIYSSTSR